jgi:hypothetical protein
MNAGLAKPIQRFLVYCDAVADNATNASCTPGHFSGGACG